jgi:crossover junction endodeoxyribonuclease RusA
MIIIPLIPMAAPRPRFSKFGTYNDKKYTTYKQALLVSARSQDKSYFNGATKLEVTFYMPIPASLSKVKQKALNGEFHSTYPRTEIILKEIK